MASLQIPFSKWDWNRNENEERENFDNSPPPNATSATCATSSTSLQSSSPLYSVTSACNSTCQSKSNHLSNMLLEGQAVLAHQFGDKVWLFVGLANGSIWKWTLDVNDAKEGGDGDSIEASLVMTGHGSSVKALAIANYRTDYGTETMSSCCNDSGIVDSSSKDSSKVNSPNECVVVESLVSLDEGGEMAVWNCHDGRCLLHNLRASATGKAAGFATSIAISPNSEYCVVAGFSDKLVVLKLATLEIVQIVGDGARWVRSAGFLLADDPDLLLDYLTLNFNAPPSQALTARQFDPQSGRFVSPACPILPSTLTPAQLAQFSSCQLLTCSRFNPGLGALVTQRRQVWLIDFLRGDHTCFSLDFEVEGVEFVRKDLLLIWSGNGGSVAFYQLFLDEQVEDGFEVGVEGGADSFEGDASFTKDDISRDDSLRENRSKSPLLGSIVRRLDMSFRNFESSQLSKLHLELLSQSGLLVWMESAQGRRTSVRLVSIQFDPSSPDRTVYLQQEYCRGLAFESGDHSGSNPVTCMIGIPEGNELLQGHANGQVSLQPALQFFSLQSGHDNVRLLPSKLKAPIRALFHQNDLIVAGDAQGYIQFFRAQCGDLSRPHLGPVEGFLQAGDWLFSWSDGGSRLAIHDLKCFKTRRVICESGLQGIYYRSTGEWLGLTGANGSKRAFQLSSTSLQVLQMSDSAFLEAISLAEVKYSLNSVTHTTLFDGIITVNPCHPSLPCHTLTVDIRLLIECVKKESSSNGISNDLSNGTVSGITNNSANTTTIIPTNTTIAPTIIALSNAIINILSTPQSSPSKIKYGLVGANGNISWSLQQGQSFWTQSPTLTGTLQLALLAMTSQAPEWRKLRSFLSVQITEDAHFKPASLSLIVKFWQDPLEELQGAARLIFSSTLGHLNSKQKSLLLSYWIDLLSSQSAQSAQSTTTVARSTVILAIILLQDPTSIINTHPTLPKLLAESLVNNLLLMQSGDKRGGMFRLAGVELIGKGYAEWQPFIHGPSIFRLLFSWYRRDQSRVILQSLIDVLLNSTPQMVSELVLQLITDAWSTSPNAVLNLLLGLLTERAGILADFLVSLVEALVLNNRGSGEEVSLLKALESHFGTISFDERLVAVTACESGEGSVNERGNESEISKTSNQTAESFNILVFDVKNRIKTATLQGHSQPATLLFFCQSSRCLLSYSAGEATVRLWSLNPSGAALQASSTSSLFFGPSVVDPATVAMSSKTLVVKPELTAAVDCFPKGSVFRLRPVEARESDGVVSLEVTSQSLMQIRL